MCCWLKNLLNYSTAFPSAPTASRPQFTLGIDRDSAIISNLFSEQNAAAKAMIAEMIRKA